MSFCIPSGDLIKFRTKKVGGKFRFGHFINVHFEKSQGLFENGVQKSGFTA
jgi:hypothetical protein